MPPSDQARWFADEVKPYEPALRAYLFRRFPSIPDHDDVVQEAYMRLVQAREAGRLTYARAFLFTAARNLAIDLLRRRKATPHEPLVDFAEARALEEPRGTVEDLARQQELELLLEAIMSLPERCRQVMMLRHLDGLGYREIGAQLGITPDTAKLHAVKGLRDCTAFFARRGVLRESEAPRAAAS